nr:PREDICTED: uncharacterized protein LOC107076046 [Lepisosteus oculatus]
MEIPSPPGPGSAVALRHPPLPPAGREEEEGSRDILSVSPRRLLLCPLGKNLYLCVSVTALLSPSVCPGPVSVSVRFGDSVSLPCDGSAYRGTPEDRIYLRWKTPQLLVYELSRGHLYTGPGFENRAEVSREKIREGNFSLTLHHPSFSDEDVYECAFKKEINNLMILGSIRLNVTARSEVLTLLSGDSLTLPLHTAEPVEVMFDPGGSAQSPAVLLSSAGLPGPGYEQRVWVRGGSLTLRSLTPADQGSYTVRDLQGNTINRSQFVT